MRRALKTLLIYALALGLLISVTGCGNSGGGGGNSGDNRSTGSISTVSRGTPCGCSEDGAFVNGEGSVADPWIVGTAEQLSHVWEHLDAHFKMDTDIDLTDYLAETGAGYNGGAGWDPIGQYIAGDPSVAFTGSFDGGGYSVTGLWFDRDERFYMGLFGYVAEGAIVSNLSVTADATGSGEDIGIAALAGMNDGEITNCSAAGTITGDGSNASIGGLVGYNDLGTVTDCSVKATITGSGNAVDIGGIIGFNSGTVVSGCTATVTISGGGNEANVGGIIGFNYDGVISDTHTYSGSISANGNNASIGGLIGFNGSGGTISNSDTKLVAVMGDGTNMDIGGLVGYNAGTINELSNARSHVTSNGNESSAGGFVGYNAGVLSDCHYAGIMSGDGIDASVGGFVGTNGSSAKITACSSTGSATGGEGTVGIGGFAGYNNGEITNSYSTSSARGGDLAFIGGLVGINSNLITNCYALSGIEALGEGADLGGLVGGNTGSGVITDCYWNIDQITVSVGNELGQTDATGMTRAEMSTTDFMDTLNANAGSDVWLRDSGALGGLPHLITDTVRFS